MFKSTYSFIYKNIPKKLPNNKRMISFCDYKYCKLTDLKIENDYWVIYYCKPCDKTYIKRKQSKKTI